MVEEGHVGCQGTRGVGEVLLVGPVGEAENDTLAEADEQCSERGGQALRLVRGHDAPVVRSSGEQRDQMFLVSPDGGGELGPQVWVVQGHVLQGDLERQAGQRTRGITAAPVVPGKGVDRR